MGSNPLPDTFFSIKFKDFFHEKFIELINLKPKEQIKPRKFKKRIFLIGHSYTTAEPLPFHFAMLDKKEERPNGLGRYTRAESERRRRREFEF